MAWGFPTLPRLIFDLERKITQDYKKLLKDILREELEFGGRVNWRKPVAEIDLFMRQLKSDIGQIHRLQDEGLLNKNHLTLLKEIDYRLSLLDRAEQQFRKADPGLSKEIQELIVDMTTSVKKLINTVAKNT
jgi:hypothetical protein